MKQFTSSNQMKAFMKKESERLNIDISNAYSTFTARTILERVSHNDKNNDIIVKGSSAEIAYLGRLARAITDVDLATVKNFELCSDTLNKVFGTSDIDQFNIVFNKDISRTNTGIYKMHLKANFDKISQPIGIDFQENYSRLIEPEKREMPCIFEGDEPFEIYLPSFEEYLAEKLCIILETNKPDVLNTRVKDFYDIYQLHGGEYDSEKLTDYFGKVIKLRNKIKLEDASTMRLNKDFISEHESVWDSTRKKYDFLDQEIDLAGAVYYTRAVLREQLQKNGQPMEDNISIQYQKKPRK